MTGPVPFPVTREARDMGCTCHYTRDCQSIAIGCDCPLHSERRRVQRVATAITHDGECDRAQPFRGKAVV